ncbi:Carboxylesterase NlhH [Defluviimonas aquaemixtae]|uniref:Carboxylesterase NlhH n=1 Tax=Albidovulum aquaemixtae TaxID=1542388 RepID=A0A2R8B552_9RHOB|nr:alpha/beta hydrolase [Defluviimonas aquaemixtae]SPH17738.1 Carboxylesterase NlhH [Defluviimonas aquaemixtae]
MPRENRVTPEGAIVAHPGRGLLTGNRGILYDTSGRRRWNHRIKAWIACRLDYPGRRQPLASGHRWTPLFFLDEAVALAAGHRPCAFCRRADYDRLRAAWAAAGLGDDPRAPEIDRCLHAARIVPRRGTKVTCRADIATLPDGAFVAMAGGSCLVLGDRLLPYAPDGYRPALPRPGGGIAEVMTPAPLVAVLAAGYRPMLHSSAAEAPASPGGGRATCSGVNEARMGRAMPDDSVLLPEYDRLLDADIRAFIREAESFYPPDCISQSRGEQRACYVRLCQAFDAPRPKGLAVTDRTFGGVPCRVYAPTDVLSGPVVVYFHGGGFVLGGLDSHDAICAELAAATGYRLVSVGYRLAPEHLHPAQYDDARAAAAAVAGEFAAPLLLAGDSAGATLAAALAHGLRGGAVAISGQVLIYPYLGGDLDRGSFLIHAYAPLLTRDDMVYYAQVRFGDGPIPRDATANPLHDSDFSGLPPSAVFVAGCDPLADDGRAYAARISAAGGRARVIEDSGLVHGYLRARHRSARARDAFRQIIATLSALGRGEAP